MYILVAAVLALLLSLVIAPIARWCCNWHSVQYLLRTTSVPGPPVPNKLTGHMDTLASGQVHQALAAWRDEYGPIYRLQVLNRLVVVVTDPAAIQQLLRKSSPDYVKKNRALLKFFEYATTAHLPNILSSSDGAYWKAVRTGLAPAFSFTNLKQVFPRVLELSQRAVGILESRACGGQEVDVSDLASRITADVIGTLLLGEDFGSLDMREDPYLEVFAATLKEVIQIFYNPFRPFMYWDADARRGKAVLHRHDKLLEAKVATALKGTPAEHTIAGHLLKVKDPATGKPLTLNQLKSELSVILGAGFETTSNAITWTLAALATHPEVQERLASELCSAGLTSRPFELGDLSRLPYLNAVIKESLRVLTPAPVGTGRLADKDLVICGHKVPKGTAIRIPMGPFGVSTDNYGPTARVFDPDRWLESSSPTSSTNTTPDRMGNAAAASNELPDPISFSLGPRDCVGQNLAKMELQVVVASLVAKFNLTPGNTLRKAVLAESAKAKGGLEQQAAVLRGIHSLGQNNITMQPKDGIFLLAQLR